MWDYWLQCLRYRVFVTYMYVWSLEQEHAAVPTCRCPKVKRWSRLWCLKKIEKTALVSPFVLVCESQASAPQENVRNHVVAAKFLRSCLIDVILLLFEQNSESSTPTILCKQFFYSPGRRAHN
jgi:hypothetical protein